MKYYEVKREGKHINTTLIRDILSKQNYSYMSMNNHPEFSWKFRTLRDLDRDTLEAINKLPGISIEEKNRL